MNAQYEMNIEFNSVEFSCVLLPNKHAHKTDAHKQMPANRCPQTDAHKQPAAYTGRCSQKKMFSKKDVLKRRCSQKSACY